MWEAQGVMLLALVCAGLYIFTASAVFASAALLAARGRLQQVTWISTSI